MTEATCVYQVAARPDPAAQADLDRRLLAAIRALLESRKGCKLIIEKNGPAVLIYRLEPVGRVGE